MSRSNITIAVLLSMLTVVLVGIVALVVLLVSTSVPTTAVSPAPAPSTSAYDPYAWYLDHAPAGAPHLSREDAQTRAFLGCGSTFAPGTVDAVLAESYKGICK